jgi:hypothetical protein
MNVRYLHDKALAPRLTRLLPPPHNQPFAAFSGGGSNNLVKSLPKRRARMVN